MQHLADHMTAKEFAQHYALEREEPVPMALASMAASVLASLANGPLKAPAPGRIWQTADFMPSMWQPDEPEADAPQQTMTVSQIMAQARAHGMV